MSRPPPPDPRVPEPSITTGTSDPAHRARRAAPPRWLPRVVRESHAGARDVVVGAIPQAVKALTGLAAAMLIARGLGPRGLGEYALVLSVASLTVGLSDLGVGQTAIRYASQAAARDDAAGHQAVIRWALRTRVALVAAISAVGFVLAPAISERVWHLPTLAPLLRLSLVIGIFEAIAAVPVIYFQSQRRFGRNAAVLVGQSLIAFAGIVALWMLDRWSVRDVVLVTLLTAAVGALAFLTLVPRGAVVAPRGPPRPGVGRDRARESFALYMVASSVIVLVTLRADVWMMGAALSEAEIGAYSAATRFMVPLSIALGALNTALWPRAAAAEGRDATVALLRRTFKLSCLLAAACVPYALVAPMLAPTLLGAEYEASVWLGQLLCLRGTLAILICPVGVVGFNLGLVNRYWLVNLLQLVAVVTINAWLLPLVGAVGAAIALIANDATGLLVLGWMIRREIRSGPRASPSPAAAEQAAARRAAAPADVTTAAVRP